MVDYINKDKFWEDSCDKQFQILIDDEVVLTNEDIHSESFKVHEALNSNSNLLFGACESSYVTFTTSHLESLQGKVITVNIILDDDYENPFTLGTYTVIKDELSGDRRTREITAYDRLYDIINADVTDWYNSQPLPMTLKAFREDFFKYFDIEEAEITLPQDSLVLIWSSNNQISGKDIICAICEINGVFGHISRNNQFEYISLSDISITEIAPSANSASGDTDIVYTKSMYESVTYSDYVCHSITQVRIKDTEGKISAIYGNETDNPYTIGGNILISNQQPSTLMDIAQSLYNKFSNIWYVNCDLSSLSNPCYEVGDRIGIIADNAIIYTYILQREISGMMLLKDNISIEGDEYYSEDLNGISDSSTVGGISDNKIAWRTYNNTYDYDLSTEINKTQIIRISVVTTIKTDLLFLATVILTTEGTDSENKVLPAIINGETTTITIGESKGTKIKLYYEWRDQEIEYYPIETYYEDDTHTLNLMYLIQDVDANIADHFDVYMEVLEGSVHINANDIKAYIQIQGGTSEFRWEGTLEFEEPISLIPLPTTAISVMGIRDSVGFAIQTPVGATLSDSIGLIRLDTGAIEVMGVTDSVSFLDFLSDMTWNEASAYTWDVLNDTHIWGEDRV